MKQKSKIETIADAPAFSESYGERGGLTKREYFAVCALQGLLACPDYTKAAKEAVKIADSLIAELNK